MKEFMKLLIAASEKAANIARIIRNEKELFNLLIQEKYNQEKNQRFIQDFKTLADVLIQESLRHDISQKYPEMTNNIYGEENNTFSNALGESITVSIQDTLEGTANLLAKVLDDGSSNVTSHAAQLLANEIHKEMNLNERDDGSEDIPQDLMSSYEDVGIWIDPIDGTNEYIKGSQEAIQNETFSNDEDPNNSRASHEPIYSTGLHCVTVLIGAFQLHSGQPIAGVINQPFYKFQSETRVWEGRRFWGLNVEGQQLSSKGFVNFPLPTISNSNATSKQVAILSSSEDPDLQKKLEKDFHLVFSSGAGYKLLCVVLGLADIYVLSKNSTHFWDTCGPHAVLKSLGGGIINYTELVSKRNSAKDKSFRKELNQIDCLISDEGKERHFANFGGIVAYRDDNVIETLLNCLC